MPTRYVTVSRDNVAQLPNVLITGTERSEEDVQDRLSCSYDVRCRQNLISDWVLRVHCLIGREGHAYTI
jgi:hypothetical protein